MEKMKKFWTFSELFLKNSAIIQINFSLCYKESVTQLNDLVLDQPMHPRDRAVWWLEYLLRQRESNQKNSSTF
jgi:hypothetical protein